MGSIDTSMDYLPKEEVMAIWNRNVALTDEELLAMDEVEFRARVRERSHHTLEIQMYHAQHRNKKLSEKQADYTKRLLGLWEKRGLSKDLPEYKYASFLVESADKLARGEAVDLTPYKPTPVTKEMEDNFFTILKERRSVREFTDQDVPDEIIEKVLDAGLWAAHGCNVQSIKYVIVREKNEPGLFRGSDVPGGPIHLVICQDMRCYRANSFTPRRNQLLDAGAAGQNIVLAAHAAGLEGVWLTFPNEEFCDRLREKFNLPEYIRLVTYVDVGYGAQTPHPPLRWDVKDTILGRF
ncbi:MAG: nitroreductase family protein [Lachnospiraceae bacterium]|nr:nitroreductase family protein [Lachnospiraceae bacterium]MCR5254885.1 nitroreductase family protein [Acetatifactor sp.]